MSTLHRPKACHTLGLEDLHGVGLELVVAGVVRRVDVDHLDLAEIRLLQELQHLQIVTFNDEILGCVEEAQRRVRSWAKYLAWKAVISIQLIVFRRTPCSEIGLPTDVFAGTSRPPQLAPRLLDL